MENLKHFKNLKFNSFFTNKGTKLAEKISDPDDDYQSSLNSFNQKK